MTMDTGTDRRLRLDKARAVVGHAQHDDTASQEQREIADDCHE